MGSSPDQNSQQEILSSLNSIIGVSERWSEYLRRRQARVRLAKALLSGLLVWFGSNAVAVALILTSYSMEYFAQNRDFVLATFGSLAVLGAIGGGVSYLLLGRRQNLRLGELSNLVAQMKNNNESQSITETALSLAENVLTLLPELIRKRNHDALLFGIVAFIIASIVARPPIGILVGVLVWLYFRFETSRTYEREISKFEEQRRNFEQRKKEFLESL